MINYMVDSENVGTKWIPYLKENIKKTDRVFLFYTDKSPTIPCGKLNDLTLFIHQIQSIHCYNKTANALDFQLCSYLGYLIRGGSKSSYCILINDKGFDAAVSFWAEKGIKIYRHSLAAEIGYPDKTRMGSMPNLGAILSLKANNPDLKTIEKIIKESDSVAVVLNKITTVLGTRTGKNYCKKLEKHLKKYYLVNK